MPRPTPIQIRGLTRTFRGGVVAVNQLDLTVEPGTVYGFIGRNGAGKTTTLRMLLGLLRADSGDARLLGHCWWTAPAAVREQVFYLPQQVTHPSWMTWEDLTRYAAHFYHRWNAGLARSLAGRWNLPMQRPMGRLSGGEQRLMALAVGLATEPGVLVLDEPGAGLDPVVRRDVHAALVEALLRVEDCTALISTHLLSDLERLATHVGILRHGRVALEGTVEDWQQAMRRVQVVFPGTAVPDGFEIPGSLRSETLGPVHTVVLRLTDPRALDGIRGIPGVRVNVFPLTLEELFMELHRGSGGVPGGGDEDLGRPGELAAADPDERVGTRTDAAAAPAGRERGW